VRQDRTGEIGGPSRQIGEAARGWGTSSSNNVDAAREHVKGGSTSLSDRVDWVEAGNIE